MDCIKRKLPDRLYNSLSKKDIATLVNLKEAAMVLGHWDADPFDNNKPRRYDSRRNSGNTHQNYCCQRNNSRSYSYLRNNNNSNISNHISPQSQGNYHEYRRNLDKGRAQNPLNFQASTSNNSSNVLVKRQGENDSVQTRMDVIFSQLPRI